MAGLSSVRGGANSLRRRLLLVTGATLADGLLSAVWGRPIRARASNDLSASIRISESMTSRNAYPDTCDSRLQRLYIAQGLELAIEVEFNRPLSEEETQQVRWLVSNGATDPDSGDFTGQPNHARIVTTTTMPAAGADNEALVHVTYQGTDLADPLPVRIVTDAEYTTAFSALSTFTRANQGFPLTSDLLARFLGEEANAAGVPTVETYPLDICDPRLTHRAGANWGTASVTDVPLVRYAADQPASSIVAEGVALALLSLHAQEIREFFTSNPDAVTHVFNYAYDGDLTLDFPLDANFALHGVAFEGTVSATVDPPVGPDEPLSARAVQVTGSVADLYDFSMEATGAGAYPAVEAAKIEIASVKHHIGKVFVVSFSLDASIPSLAVYPVSA